MSDEAGLRGDALSAVRRYADEALRPAEFVPGETTVPVAGRVIGAPELEALVDASLDGWLTEGRFAGRFAPAFARAAGRERALLVGSGSQANLLAVAARLLAAHGAAARAGRRGDHARARLLDHDRARSTSTGSCRSSWTWSSTRSTRRSTRSRRRSASAPAA